MAVEAKRDLLAEGELDPMVWAQEYAAHFGGDPGVLCAWFAAAMGVQQQHAVSAIGWLSAHLAGKADTWEGNAPAWFPEPPEWLDLWQQALTVTREAPNG